MQIQETACFGELSLVLDDAGVQLSSQGTFLTHDLTWSSTQTSASLETPVSHHLSSAIISPIHRSSLELRKPNLGKRIVKQCFKEAEMPIEARGTFNLRCC